MGMTSNDYHAQHSLDDLLAPESNNAASPTERQYGTFEVSVIEVDHESEDTRDRGDESVCRQTCSMCSDDCCFIMSLLMMPARLLTYKILVFHVANFFFAAGAAVWTAGFHLVWCIVGNRAPWSNRLRRTESSSLRWLLENDSKLFNFISPPQEQVIVYSCSTHLHKENSVVYSFDAQIYFGFVKFLCSAIPGFMCSAMFLWSLLNLVYVLAGSAEAVVVGRSAVDSLTGRPLQMSEDFDIVVLMSVLSIYGSAMLIRVCAFISRHVTVFFCAEYLLYAQQC
ncbi:TPA: hypothetical protein N0F65_005439 [Lagenidium giganteum]|uniref:Uncharacterized protein n=1 Tax=Lagenidium giganteum TaxID=4803 RepID=A0AAV2YY11_9STRA|nr:TPA: hypothetical protein N0F65_005439 [Lagenidium giganteum]